MSSRMLDVLLAQVREPEPVDDGFVASVMADIEDLGVVTPPRLTALRRPLIAITATAVVLTGGAVAALVGTRIVNVDEGGPARSEPRASVSVSSGPEDSSSDTASDPRQALATAEAERESAIKGSRHTVSVIDPKTGLRLQTETYTNEFRTGRPQRVTLTLENTREKPLAVTGYKDCSLQAMAFPMSSGNTNDNRKPSEYYEEYRNETGVEWVCSGSGASPRVPTAAADTIVLQPGATHTDDAMLTLPSDGDWGVMGMCRCDVTDPTAPSPRDNPFGDFTQRVLPSPLVTLDFDTGEGTITPPIRVRAKSD